MRLRGLGDHAHVVRDHDERHVTLLLQGHEQVEDLRLDRHVERGRRLVGDEQLGIAGDRHGDHHALVHAAGELVRERRQAAFRRRDADLLQQFDGAALGAPCDPCARAAASVSVSWKPMVKQGLRLVVGSWKIIATSLPVSLRRSRSEIVSRSCPLNDSLSAVTRPGKRHEAHERQHRHALAGARFADDAREPRPFRASGSRHRRRA